MSLKLPNVEGAALVRILEKRGFVKSDKKEATFICFVKLI